MNCYKKIMIGEILELDIMSLASGGKGFARTDKGQAIFISDVIPGERVYARVVREHTSYLEAAVEKILEASSERVKPACAKFELCGGCDWQHIRYSEQVRWKDAILKNHMRKAISGEHTHCIPAAASPVEYGYRSHIRLQSDGSSTGFYMKNTNRIVEINDCPIAAGKIRDALTSLKKHITSLTFRNKISSFELFAFDGRLQALIHLSNRAGTMTDSEVSRICNDMDMSGAVITYGNSHKQEVFGDGGFTYNIDAASRRFVMKGGLGGFIQSNPHVNRLLVEYAVELVKGSDKVLDFYCGCGNFTIPLASVCRAVTGIDHDRRLTDYVMDNAGINGLDNVSVMTSDIESIPNPLTLPSCECDAVLMDPPRSGSVNLAKLLGRMKPGMIVYISCEPSTMARDLNIMKAGGYVLESIRMFDMFPQTHHIEAVACLKR